MQNFEFLLNFQRFKKNSKFAKIQNFQKFKIFKNSKFSKIQNFQKF
jgi:hypothetical protein